MTLFVLFFMTIRLFPSSQFPGQTFPREYFFQAPF